MIVSYMSPLSFTLVAAIVSSLSFRKHEPDVVKFFGICFTVTTTNFVYYTAQGKNDYVQICCLALFQLMIYLVSLGLLVLEYRLSLRHPLAQFPGPLMAKATKWYMVCHVLTGRRHTTLQRLHTELGPCVRIGPNELSINDVNAIKPIYLHLLRAPSYRGVPAKDETLIMIVDRKRHAARRKSWARAFASKMLYQYIPATNKRAQQLVHSLMGQAEVDLHYWLSLCLMDIIGDLGFSGGIESLAARKDTAKWMTTLNLGALVVGILGQVPWLTNLILLLPQKGPIETFHQFAKEKVEEAQMKHLTSDCDDILSIILNDTHSTSHATLSEGEAAADASLLMASSVETTSQALTTLFRYVFANPSILKQLQKEIDSFFPSLLEKSDIISRDTKKMVFLNACIKEALRLMPPVPAGLPRSSGSDGCLIIGYYIPPNTTVHVPTYTLQRDAVNFAEPDVFSPYRWLPLEQKFSPHNEDAYIPFGVGLGACVGQQLALQNMKIIVICIISQLDIKISQDVVLEHFDASYKDYGLWRHNKFLVDVAKHSRYQST